MVLGLLILVALLVGGGLLLVRLALGFGQSLPLVAEHLADLAWVGVKMEMRYMETGVITHRS